MKNATRTKLEGKKVLVIGLARSGQSAIELLLEQGAVVTGTDLRTKDELGAAAKEMRQAGATLVLGRHPTEIFLESDLIVVSPGVPRSLVPLEAARKAGVEIAGELELASWFVDFPLVAVTGTNGKSTTTTFIGHFLRGAGRRVFVGGNLGTPLCRAVNGDHDVGVVEVSSYQLEWAPTFRPEVAVLLNVSEDHLDRYRDFREYAETKGRLFGQQREIDFAVANQGDPLALELAGCGAAQRYTFGHGADGGRGIRHYEGALWYGEGEQWTRISLEGFKPRGRHNIENLMAAFLSARLAGVRMERLVELIPHLEGLPHRLELVRELDGVTYYNDSKATNVNSVLCSLRDFKEPLVLLMGGRDKGGSYAPLIPIVRERARAILAFGEAAPLIREALGDVTELLEVETIKEAVRKARALARAGDSVVLSPACSSFDQFPNYEVRGDTFKRLVGNLEALGKEL